MSHIPAAGAPAPEGPLRRWLKRWLGAHGQGAIVARETIDRCFAEALLVWKADVTLSPPRPLGSRGRESWGGGGVEPLAYIDLATHEVVVNFELLARIGAMDSLTAILAHEIGHHVRYPSNLHLVADLMLLEQRLVPGLQSSLTNLFFDLLVNEVVGRTRSDELVAVYRGFGRLQRPEPITLFGFYLAIYEELWGKPAGTLVGDAQAAALDREHPGWRDEARQFVRTFYGLTELHLQFIYFLSRLAPYIPDPASLTIRGPLAADVPMPHVDDFRLVAGNDAALEHSLEAARERGWLTDSGLLGSLPADTREAAGPALGPGETVDTAPALPATAGR